MTEREQTRSKEVAELESRRGTDHELDGFTRVGRLPSRQKEARAVISLRMSASEMQEITAAARALELNVSEFIREAALRDARQVRAGIAEARQAALNKKG